VANKDQKQDALNGLVDTEEYILLTDKGLLVAGEEGNLKAMIAAAVYNKEEFRNIILEGIQLAIDYKNMQQ
jgi:SpoVK/Ycf46/Vps4 family AAA+-type ATPase